MNDSRGYSGTFTPRHSTRCSLLLSGQQIANHIPMCSICTAAHLTCLIHLQKATHRPAVGLLQRIMVNENIPGERNHLCCLFILSLHSLKTLLPLRKVSVFAKTCWKSDSSCFCRHELLFQVGFPHLLLSLHLQISSLPACPCWDSMTQKIGWPPCAFRLSTPFLAGLQNSCFQRKEIVLWISHFLLWPGSNMCFQKTRKTMLMESYLSFAASNSPGWAGEADWWWIGSGWPSIPPKPSECNRQALVSIAWPSAKHPKAPFEVKKETPSV